jgi:hypothetical protein
LHKEDCPTVQELNEFPVAVDVGVEMAKLTVFPFTGLWYSSDSRGFEEVI